MPENASNLKYKLQAGLLIILIFPLLLASCGKKGDPTLKPFEKPAQVKEMKAVHREGEITISWSYPASEKKKIKGFHLERSLAGETYKRIAFLKSEESQFVDRDFSEGRAYLYKIRALSLKDVISDDSLPLMVTPHKLPAPPSKLSFTITHDSMEIRWEKVLDSRAIKYNIYRSYEKGRYPLMPLNSAPLTEPIFRDRIYAQKTVYYMIRSLLDTEIRDEGYPSVELEVNPWSFIPSRPDVLNYVPSEKKIYLLWSENKEIWVKGYRIYRKRIAEPEFRLIGESVTPAFTDNEPLTVKTFYYITALGPERESIPSAALEAHPVKIAD